MPMNKTEKAFRLAVLRWKNEQPSLFSPSEYCYHAIASNLQNTSEEVIWQYNGRGQAENIIKELKGGFSGEKCMSFG
jgi:hypothetical protein